MTHSTAILGHILTIGALVTNKYIIFIYFTIDIPTPMTFLSVQSAIVVSRDKGPNALRKFRLNSQYMNA